MSYLQELFLNLKAASNQYIRKRTFIEIKLVTQLLHHESFGNGPFKTDFD